MSDKRLELYYKLKERVLQLKAKLQSLEADSKVQKKIRNDIIAAHKILTDMLEAEIKELQTDLDNLRTDYGRLLSSENELQAKIKELKISESDSHSKAKEYFSLAANEKETLKIARETIMSLQAELKRNNKEIFRYNEELSDALSKVLQLQAEFDKHRKAIKIALDFISAEGDCVEQSKRQEIEQALKGTQK